MSSSGWTVPSSCRPRSGQETEQVSGGNVEADPVESVGGGPAVALRELAHLDDVHRGRRPGLAVRSRRKCRARLRPRTSGATTLTRVRTSLGKYGDATSASNSRMKRTRSVTRGSACPRACCWRAISAAASNIATMLRAGQVSTWAQADSGPAFGKVMGGAGRDANDVPRPGEHLAPAHPELHPSGQHVEAFFLGGMEVAIGHPPARGKVQVPGQHPVPVSWPPRNDDTFTAERVLDHRHVPSFHDQCWLSPHGHGRAVLSRRVGGGFPTT